MPCSVSQLRVITRLMKTWGITLSVALALGCAHGRKMDPNAAVHVQHGVLSNTYRQGGERLDTGSITETLAQNPKTAGEIQAAKRFSVMATILGVAGGALVGYPIGQALGGGEPRWVMAAVGGGMIVIAVPIGASADGHVQSAVEIHNTAFGAGTPPTAP